MKKHPLSRTVLSAMLLAIAVVLPFFTGQLRQIGKMLCPMHLPVLLCGYFCGPWYAAAVGAIAPLLRAVLFGVPPIMPRGLAMASELAAYGIFAALFDRLLPKKKPFLYLSLIGAMLAGRAVWGIASAALYGAVGKSFGLQAFLAGAFVEAVPGILLQLLLVPPLVMALRKNK